MLWWCFHFLFMISILLKIISITTSHGMIGFVWILTSIDLSRLTKHFKIFLWLHKPRTPQFVNIFIHFGYPRALHIGVWRHYCREGLNPRHPTKLNRIFLRSGRIIFSLSIKLLLIEKLQWIEVHPSIIWPSSIRILPRTTSGSARLSPNKVGWFLDF